MQQPTPRPHSIVASSLANVLTGTSLVLLVGMAVLLLGVGQWSRMEHMDDACKQARSVARLAAAEMARRVEMGDLVLDQVVELASRTDLSDHEAAARLRPDLRRLALHLANVSDILIIDAKAHPAVTALHDALLQADVSDLDYFASHRSGHNELEVSAPARTVQGGPLVFSLSRGIPGPQGEFRGVAVVTFRSASVSRLLETLSLSLPARIAVLGGDNRLLAHYPVLSDEAVQSATLPAEFAGVSATSAEGSLVNHATILAWSRLDGVPLTVVTAVPLAEVLSGWRHDILPSLIFGLAALGGVTVLGGVAVRRAHAEHRVQTSLLRAGEVLEAMLEEKDALLAEVHHRVKNNLQVVINLVTMESLRLGDGLCRGRLEALGRRIAMMGRLHEKIYASDSFSRVNLGAHLVEHCGGLAAAADGQAVAVKAEQLTCALDVALPLALIAHELVTNALSHGKGAQPVEVWLIRHADGVELVVRDPGQGPSGVGLGMGLTLVQALAGQLEALLSECREDGYRVSVRVPEREFTRSSADLAAG